MEKKSELKNHLRELEEKLLTPEARSSKEQLKKLLADDFFEFGSSGMVLFKDEAIPEEGIGIVQMQMTDFEIHPLSEDVVLATYRIFNEINQQNSLRSSIWKLIDGDWKMVFHQGTNNDA